MKKKLIKLFYKYKPKIIIGIISLLLIIIGILIFSSIIPIIPIIIVDVIYYIPFLRKKAVIFMRNVLNRDKKKGAHAKGTHKKLAKKKNALEKKEQNINIPKKKKKKKKIWKILLIVLLSGIILVVGAIIAVCIYIVSHAPNFDPKKLYASEPSVVYDSEGNEYFYTSEEVVKPMLSKEFIIKGEE